MEAGPPPHPHPPAADREPLSLGEIREIWPLLALPDRIQAFLLLPRDEAEDFFFGLPARDQADVVLGVPAREQRSWLRWRRRPTISTWAHWARRSSRRSAARS